MSNAMLICHALPDRDIARLVENLLDVAGLVATLSPIPVAGEAFEQAADDAPATMKFAIVVVGADTSSPYFHAEVARLLARAAAEPEFRLLPLLLPGAMLDDLPALANFPAVDLRLDGDIADTLGKLAGAAPLLGADFLQATRRRPDLVAGLLAGLAKRWWALRQNHRAEHLFELAAGLLERAETPRDDAEPAREGEQGLLAYFVTFGLHVLDTAANAPAADPDAAPTDADGTAARKALVARLGTWAAEMLERGNLAGARRAFERVLPLAKSAFGDDSRTTLDIAAGLARSLRGLGELEQAQAIEEDTLARLLTRAGNDDAATLTATSNLAITLAARGFLAEARTLQESVLAARRRVLGDSHPETLTAMGNLAGTLHAQGDYAGARALREFTLAGRRALFGADFPETMAAAWNLLVTCLAMGDILGATKLVETELAPLFNADATGLPADLARIRADLVDLVRVPTDVASVATDLAAGGQAAGASQ